MTSTVCIVGGGPAGVTLALLLLRQGIPVTLLEAGNDFDRDFRGDTLSPGVLEIMDEMGLVERLLKLKNGAAVKTVNYVHRDRDWVVADFSRLKSRFPYLFVLPQRDFLEFMIQEATHLPGFELLMGATVHDLIEKEGIICGVRYKKNGQSQEICSSLTVGADGRTSRVRKLAGLEMRRMASPIDLICFRIPRLSTDPAPKALNVYVGDGYYFGIWDRFDYWQINAAIPKGSYAALRSLGIVHLQKQLIPVLPELALRMGGLQWSDVSTLCVEPGMASRWYRPGLLLIGDAAHVMSPAGGVGINCAIQDAVATTNVLTLPLRRGDARLKDLAEVQRIRKWPVWLMQKLQDQAQKRLITKALTTKKYRIPFYMQHSWTRDLATRITGMGIKPVHVKRF